MTTTFPIHETLPEGFTYADRLQVEAFMATGSVPGASRVTLVAGAGELPRLACRLRPPRDRGVKYISDYRAGWTLGKAGHARSETANEAFSDGWWDATTGRMKWHLPHCTDHGQGDDCCGLVI